MVSDCTTPDDVVVIGKPCNAVMPVKSPIVNCCAAFVRCKSKSSDKANALFVAKPKYARLLKFATQDGTTVSGFTARFEPYQTGAVMVDMSIAPNATVPCAVMASGPAEV